MAPEFFIVQLSKDLLPPIIPRLVGSLKALRLESLQTNPEAFGSSYEREAAFNDATWESRLKNPAAIVVAIDVRNLDISKLSNDEIAASAPWIGSMAQIGPVYYDGAFPNTHERPRDEFHKAMIDIPVADADETRDVTLLYAVNGVYVTPSWRGKGVAKGLMKGAMKAAEDDLRNRSAKRGTCVIFVNKDNVAGKKLYEGAGFTLMGEQEYTSVSGRLDVCYGFKKDLDTVLREM